MPTLDIAIFARGIQALQNGLEESGHGLLIASAQYSVSKEIEQVRTLIERKVVDGIVLVGNQHHESLFDLIRRARIPLVTTYLHSPDSPLASVGFDNEAASRRIVRHLIDIGHRDIGLITSPVSENDRIRARLEGMIKGLAEAGLAVPRERVVEVPYSILDGRRALRALLALGDRVTAIACTTDVLAVGVVLEALERRIRIPGELSVTGFDDLDLAREINPPLTTIHVPADEIGRKAADLLVSKIQNKPSLAHVEVAAELLVRASTAPPSAGRGSR